MAKPNKPAAKRRPGGKSPGGKSLGKRKARSVPQAVAAATANAASSKASGDVDDFMDMLNEIPEPGHDSDSGGEAEEDVDGQQAAGQPPEGAAQEEQPKKKRKKPRKKGLKASAVEFEASRELAAEIAEGRLEDQADWVWHSYQMCTGASSLEREGLTGDCFAELPREGSLEDRLKALEPKWRARFCNQGGGSGGGGSGWGAKGSPALLLVSPAAMGAVKLIKHCPEFHKACRVAKLFAKHIKVPEQQELLDKNVVCVAAGTPNRIAKLADLQALKLDNLRYVVVDTSLDAKKRTILDIPETRADWTTLLRTHLLPRLASGQTKLVLVNSDKLA